METDSSSNFMVGGVSEDIKAQLRDRLLNLPEFESLMAEIKFLRRDDIMTYLAVREEFRSSSFAAVSLMAVGLITVIFSLLHVD